jgi:transposase
VLFDWVDEQLQRQGPLPSNPFTKALAFARERRLELRESTSPPTQA